MSEQTAGKGRPTPKRSDAQKRRGGPVAPPPTNRREAAKQLRAKQADARQSVRKANITGDDALLLKRDQGPVRRAVRDIVDGRRNLGFLLLPVAVIVVVAGFTPSRDLQAITFGIWLATLLGVFLDMLQVGFTMRNMVRRDFPGETKRRGHVAYGLLRTTVIRRFRMPRPQVTRGR